MKDQGHITVGHLMIFGPPIQETPKCTQVQWPLVECPGFSGDILRQTPSNMTWHGHRCSLWVCIFRGYPPMHFFWRHGKHPMVICNFPWFPRGFPMISYKAWGLWLDVFSFVVSINWILDHFMGNKARIWRDGKRPRVAPDGGTVVPLFNHFTTKKNNDIFRSCGCSCCIGTSLKWCYSNR